MMTIPPHQLQKLDGDLAYVVTSPAYRPQEKIPVAIVADPEQFDAIARAVEEHGGEVRHFLRLAGAVAAWLPIESILSLSSLEIVQDLELDQQMHIA